MGVFGMRLDIFVICWFLGMGMVNYLDAATGIFGYQIQPRYNVTDIAGWQGINVGYETNTSGDYNEASQQPADVVGSALGVFTYTFKAAMFLGSVLWNSTLGLHTFLRDNFGIPYIPWGLPIMILVNLVNFLGLIELWTKTKI